MFITLCTKPGVEKKKHPNIDGLVRPAGEEGTESSSSSIWESFPRNIQEGNVTKIIHQISKQFRDFLNFTVSFGFFSNTLLVPSPICKELEISNLQASKRSSWCGNLLPYYRVGNVCIFRIMNGTNMPKISTCRSLVFMRLRQSRSHCSCS